MSASATLSFSGLAIALLVPWLCGCIWVRALLGRSGRYNWAVVMGQGFFLGYFAITLLIRLWDAMGLALSFPGLAAVLIALGVLGIALPLRRPLAELNALSSSRLPLWQVLAMTLLLALLAWRQLTLLQELVLRPLYAWDAWMNWAPKAIVWFQQGALVDFVSPQDWLHQSGAQVYTLGNGQAWPYPMTVPLIQLWCMLGAGTWDHSLLYLPWWLASLCLGLALYGHLRLAGTSVLGATVACYLLLSMPYINVHTVLAGYADIWLAAAFGLGVCALYEWQRSRHWAWAVLALALAWLCAQLKLPGIILGLTLVVCTLYARVRLRPARLWPVLAGLLVLTLGLLATGVSMELPYIGHVALGLSKIELGIVGSFELQYHSIGASFVQAFLVMINWHLLFYLLPPLFLYSLLQGGLLRLPTAEVVATVMSLVMIVFVFMFSDHYQQALNFATLNRALLYPIPAIIFCCGLRLVATTERAHRHTDAITPCAPPGNR